MKKKVIYYNNNDCNPFVRIILRSVFLVDEIKVDFVRKNNCKFVFKKRHLYWEDLIKKLSEVALSTKIFEEGEMIFELKSLVKNKEKVDKAITTIVKYLYTEGSVRDEERFIEKWEEFYGKKGKVNLKMGTNINAVNYNETATYLKLFAIQKESMKHMENATATLLETIPCEVNTIADIGSGPGLVNQYIPYYYDVLAVDINQEILRQNRRKTCIGDILDLPLQDKSVDMTISCDVLEHIEPDKLNRAVSELKRVSKKYIYIQVPHDEILRYGIAKCPNCGNIWHVNFHKNKFTLDILKRYEDNEWKISQINYTGEVKNEIDNPEIYAKIEKDNLNIFRVENFDCPECGTASTTINLDKLEEMERYDCLQDNNKEIVPKYSEIAVLFERRSKSKRKYQAQAVKDIIGNEKLLYKNNQIDFTKRFMTKAIYTGKEQIPVFFEGSSKIEYVKGGIYILGNEIPWVGIAFPFVIAENEITIEGECQTELEITIVGIDKNEQEFVETKLFISKGNFSYKHKMSLKWKEHSTFLKIYFSRDFILSNLKVERKEYREYYFIKKNDVDRDHYSLIREDMLFRYYISEQGVAFESKNGIIKIG